MNDMAKPPVLFEIPKPLAEKVNTRNFGMVTMTAPAPSTIERIVGGADRAKDTDVPYRALVAECATGEHGERFTPALLAKLPGQCYVDWLDLRAAAIRVCGLSRDNVGNI
ncbi:hypothetical protein [Paraburkholderia terrae]|uniref:Uncharacterized protein n=2 Tax=Paraburkholderia terrae TaxID=311230 RepID=A0A2I8EU11_9BURK|nr:hypothetical protein [Paraburkholderia terrae]AUT62882.1 hypothetical protein C2L65_25240 [Paraburkholderia terrae]